MLRFTRPRAPRLRRIFSSLSLTLCLFSARNALSSCDVTFDVAQTGQPYATIQSAVNAITTPLTQNVCVIIHDSQTYGEHVIVGGISNLNYTITIEGDPALAGSWPTVNPPSNSTAAFAVQNASVTLENLIITNTNSATYGIVTSSALTQINAVQVTNALVSLSDYSTLVNSTITRISGWGKRASTFHRRNPSSSTGTRSPALQEYRRSLFPERQTRSSRRTLYAGKTAAPASPLTAEVRGLPSPPTTSMGWSSLAPAVKETSSSRTTP